MTQSLKVLGLIDEERMPKGKFAVLKSQFILDKASIDSTKLVIQNTTDDDLETDIAMIDIENDEELGKTNSSSSLFWGNLSYNTTENTLRDIICPFGNIESIKIPKDFYSGKSRGYAFVEMKNHKKAKEVLNNLNGIIIDGRIVYVSWNKNDY